MSKHVIKTAKAFAPAAISSFFEIHDTEGNKPIVDLEKVGARGGGFGLQKGVLTQVTVEEAKSSGLTVIINGKRAPEAKTTKMVIETLLNTLQKSYVVIVNHKIDVPIGTGFGTSAGGALTAGLALKEALDLPLTYNQIGKIAHVAEIQCRTGLGTVSSLTSIGGCVLGCGARSARHMPNRSHTNIPRLHGCGGLLSNQKPPTKLYLQMQKKGRWLTATEKKP